MIHNQAETYNFHVANHETMWQFPSKCRDREFPVKVRAQVDTGSNIVITIEYANTNAKYWWMQNAKEKYISS